MVEILKIIKTKPTWPQTPCNYLVKNERQYQMTNQLFSTGTARGGTGLVAHMLSAHPKIKIASDPLLGLYKLFRNEVISAAGDFTFESFDPTDPFGDNYFTVERRKMLDLLLNADLGSALPQSDLKSLHLSLKNRAKLASADLVPHIEFHSWRNI